jgi:hypothetical protein
MRSALMLIALAGCDQLFGIKATHTIDADTRPPPDGPPPPPTFVQVAAGETMTALSVGTTFAMPVTAGDMLVVGVYVESAQIGTVSDSQGNAFQSPVGNIDFVPFGGKMYLYYATASKSGDDTVTVTGKSGTTDLLVMAHEYAKVTAFESANGATGNNFDQDGMKSGDLATTGTNHLIFGFGVALTVAAGAGFVTRSSFDNNITEDELVDAAGTYQATATNTGTDGRWTMLGAAFRGL